jgi:hypothetical protein
MAYRKIKVHILTNNDCPNSRAFNFPLAAARNFFSARGFSLKFFYHPGKNIFDCDIVFVNSKFFRYDWRRDKNRIFDFLSGAREKKVKSVWFDTTDSTWCTQFEALPFVDLFLKNQLLKDKSKYLEPFKTGRIYTDFFDELYDCAEKTVNYPVPEKKHLGKLGLSWNTCFENYTPSRYGTRARLKQRLRGIFPNLMSEKLSVHFVPPEARRNIALSCRLGLGHSRKSVVAHRSAIIEKAVALGASKGKIPLKDYFTEMCNAKVATGPFGVGEITLRDFEIIICGAALLKPDMSHMETWPELFMPGKTFIPHKWDLSDFTKKARELIENDDLRVETASNARKTYKYILSREGLEKFTERLVKKISAL